MYKTNFFIECCGFDPVFTNLIEVLQLVLETVYDDKNDWNVERSTCGTKSCQDVNLVAKQLYRLQGCVQICLWQSWQEVLVDIFKLCRLDGNGREL